MSKRICHFFVRLLVSTLVVALFFILTQDFQIFPGTISSLLGNRPEVPNDVEESRITTRDGETISLWRVQAKGAKQKQVVLIFHGNAEELSTVVAVQRWFATLGFTNYAVEYRGYGASTGFPSEAGLYLDGEAAVELLLVKESISSDDLIIFGNSIGTGPATYVAQKYAVGTLIMIAPYVSLTEVVRAIPFFGFLHPFLWYHFPNQEYITKLNKTCIVAAHGKHDTVIPFQHSEELKRSYHGTRSYTLITSETAGHNDIFASVNADISQAMYSCLNTYNK